MGKISELLLERDTPPPVPGSPNAKIEKLKAKSQAIAKKIQAVKDKLEDTPIGDTAVSQRLDQQLDDLRDAKAKVSAQIAKLKGK